MAIEIDRSRETITALKHLAGIDADLARAWETVGHLPVRRRAPGFAALSRIVIEQQLSVAAANTIWTRLEARVAPFEPGRVLEASDEDLRACGLSRPKVKYCRNLAEAVASGALDFEHVHGLDDSEAIAALSAVKGIGRWTAEIYLLFGLGRNNVWPAGDLALQEALRQLKRMRKRPDQARMDREARKWQPYRGIAARLLWRYYGHMRQIRTAAD